MKVSDDPNISREALKGFYMFLYAESKRHQEDIDMIEERLDETVDRANISPAEIVVLKEEASRYVHF